MAAGAVLADVCSPASATTLPIAMRRVRRLLLLFLFATAAVVLAFPFALYRLGLDGIDGFPPKPSQLVSREQQGLVWQQARGNGPPHIGAMHPYSFALGFLANTGARTSPDQTIAWQVASAYLVKHRHHEGMGWWHLPGAAVTVWLTRHWTSEELLSAAFYIRAEQQPCRLSGASDCMATKSQRTLPELN